MGINLEYCWSCGKFGMAEVELKGDKWLKCKYCGVTAAIKKRGKGKHRRINQKRSKATQFEMPGKYFGKRGKR